MWFKVDDKLWGHPKWMALPAGARALWVTAGSYCASNETDGHVPASMLAVLGARRRDAQALVEAGLWDVAQPDASQNSATSQPDASQTSANALTSTQPNRRAVRGAYEARARGYQFHDWADYQPTKAQVRAERDAAKERQRKWREARQSRRDNAVSNGVTNGVTNAVSNAAPTRPDPTPPTPPSPNTSPTSPTPTSAHADGESDFTTFWALYPRKVNRTAATTAWRRTTRTHHAADILAGLRQQLPNLEARDAQYVPHPDAWLRKERWLDDPGEPERDPWAHLPSLSPDTPDATA